MSLVRSRPYGPISDARMKAFEKSLPAELPADYRAFVIEHNGAEFSTPELDEESAADLDEEDTRGGPIPGLTSSSDRTATDARRDINGSKRRGGRGKRILELSVLDGRGAESRAQTSTVTLD